MRSHVLFLLLLLTAMFSNAQIKDYLAFRLEYKFTYCQDSTKPDIKKTDIMYLDIVPDSGSIFYSKDVREKDKMLKQNETTMSSMINSGVLDAKQMQKFWSDGVDETVIKLYNKPELNHGIYAGNFIYYTEPIPKMNWQLQTDTISINGLLCQKATTTYGGRLYIVWFSKKIETTDGPWKFSGLPGGVVKVYDSQNYFTYELKEIINLGKERIELRFSPDAGFYASTKEKVLQLMKSYYEDPTGTAEALGTTITTSSNTIGRKNAPKYFNPQERE